MGERREREEREGRGRGGISRDLRVVVGMGAPPTKHHPPRDPCPMGGGKGPKIDGGGGGDRGGFALASSGRCSDGGRRSSAWISG